MKILNVNIANKIATYIQRGGKIVCGNDGYKIQFTFDAEWDAYEEKTARFKWNGEYCDVKFTGDTVTVPRVSNTTELEVGVYAGETLCTSTSTTIECLLSCLCGTATQNPYEEGFKAGQAAGYEAGYEAGYAQGVEDSKPPIFYIDGFSKEFEKGMLWSQWVVSEYNDTDAFDDNGVAIRIFGLSLIYTEDGEVVTPLMPIIPNHYYRT